MINRKLLRLEGKGDSLERSGKSVRGGFVLLVLTFPREQFIVFARLKFSYLILVLRLIVRTHCERKHCC